MRGIKKMPNRVIFYKLLVKQNNEEIIVGPYCKVVTSWPKGFYETYKILEINKFNIGALTEMVEPKIYKHGDNRRRD